MVRSINDISALKEEIKRLYGPTKYYKPHLTGNTTDHIQLMRIRLGLSALNAQRRRYNFIAFSSCPHCQADHEDEMHFFMICTQYTAQRQEMFAQISQLTPHLNQLINNIQDRKSQRELLRTIINGTGTENTDNKLFSIVATFIGKSKRFHRD